MGKLEYEQYDINTDTKRVVTVEEYKDLSDAIFQKHREKRHSDLQNLAHAVIMLEERQKEIQLLLATAKDLGAASPIDSAAVWNLYQKAQNRK